MLLGILVATRINETVFERREGFFPPASPSTLLSAHLGDLPQCGLTQSRIKPTHPPIALLPPTTVLFKTGPRVSVQIAAVGLKGYLVDALNTVL